MNYYVYIYLDTRKPGNYTYGELNLNYEPIYVGKGTKRRYKNHLSLRCKMENNFYHKLNKIIDDGFEPEIIITKDNISENEAFEYEIELIKNIGRLIDNSGTLTNLTIGGEGSSGRICEKETKLKISEANKGENNGMFNKIHPMKGKSFDEFFGIERSAELKNLISKNANPTNKGKKMSVEYCKNISESICYWYKNNPDIKQKISNTLKKRFENKENHPMFGKHLSEISKNKLSASLIQHYKDNPHKKLSDDIKKKMSISSIGSKNSSFTIYTIQNLKTSEIIILNGLKELKKFILNFKKENNLSRTNPPSFNLIKSGKCDRYFQLIDKKLFNKKS